MSSRARRPSVRSFSSPRESEEDRQGDFASAKIVADALAELGLPCGKIEHVVDQLECDPQIAAEIRLCGADLVHHDRRDHDAASGWLATRFGLKSVFMIS